MSDDKVTPQEAQGGGQNSPRPAHRPRADWNTETFLLKVRSMRAIGVPDEMIGLDHFGEWDERIEKRLARARRKLPHNARDQSARKAQGEAQRRLKDAETREGTLVALIAWLQATIVVLEAEPDEFRDWLPHVIIDCRGGIASTERELAELRKRAGRRASQLENVKDRRRHAQLEALGRL